MILYKAMNFILRLGKIFKELHVVSKYEKPLQTFGLFGE